MTVLEKLEVLERITELLVVLVRSDLESDIERDDEVKLVLN